MNTPSHLAISLLVFRRQSTWPAVLAVALGAVLPDLPMFGFYLYQKLWLGTAEQVIWTERYFAPHWQLLFDLFHSIPILATLTLLCWLLPQLRLGTLLFASALLHQFFDLPLHHFDAHRHFLPFSDWRFLSPISYWDPRFYGQIFMWVELATALGTSGYVVWTTEHRPMRITASVTFALFLAFLMFAMLNWGGHLA